MTSLAQAFRPATARLVVDKTGLTGSYRMTMNFDMAFVRRGPDAPVAPDAPPSVVAAVQEQLGLKLVSAQDDQTTVGIAHIEQPTPD